MKNNRKFFKIATVCIFIFCLLITMTSCGETKKLKNYDESANIILDVQQKTLVTEIQKVFSTGLNEEEKEALTSRINYASSSVSEDNKEINSQINAIVNNLREENINYEEQKNILLSEFQKIKTNEELKTETALKTFKEKIRTFIPAGLNDSFKKSVLEKLESEFNKIDGATLGNNSDKLENIYNDINDYAGVYIEVVGKIRVTSVNMNELKTIVLNTTIEAIRTEMNNYKNNHAENAEDFRVKLLDKAYEQHESQLENVVELDYLNVKDEEIKDSKNGYQILKNFTLDVTKYTSTKYQEPIYWKPIKSFGDFFSNFFNNFLVFPIGWLMKIISSLFGGYYVIGLLLTTILVRTIAWPIYTKTNDMTLKMQLMQPELTKLQAKYANRPDPESQNQMRMEQARLYKKYKIGIGGCLLQFLQFPIFIAVYNAVNRMPYTTGEVPGSNDWLSKLNTNVFGIDLLKDHGALWSNDFWAIILIILLVLLTQQINQKVTEARQKAAQEKAQENVPSYRRQAAAQGASNSTMKYMMMFLSVMMVVFVWQSAAGLGIYWLIGNVYSTVQSVINNKLSEKRAEKLRNKYENYNY